MLTVIQRMGSAEMSILNDHMDRRSTHLTTAMHFGDASHESRPALVIGKTYHAIEQPQYWTDSRISVRENS
jgi:hypothetical protein